MRCETFFFYGHEQKVNKIIIIILLKFFDESDVTKYQLRFETIETNVPLGEKWKENVKNVE